MPSPKSDKKTMENFSIAKSVLERLPIAEKPSASIKLLEKSLYQCALCGRPLGADPDAITVDHRIPESAGGKTILSNLYLAHKSCNSSRQNLDFELARPLVEFKAFAEERHPGATFDDIIDRYITDGRKTIKYTIENETIALTINGIPLKLPLYTDPATKTKFSFAEIPIQYLFNDIEVQPRVLIYTHVRKLAVDFWERPVHEPSNCRLVTIHNNQGELRQFDGQHKTTAQILIGRKNIPIKIYINPDIPMLQGLIVKIQQDIKKQPLTRSETLAKMGDVIKNYIDSYEPKNGIRTEKGLIEFQEKTMQKEVEKLYFSELARIIYYDSDNELTKFVSPGDKNKPTTDKVVIDKIIMPLISKKLLETSLSESGERDNERRLILLVLNTIRKKMLPIGWNDPKNEQQHIRTINFFYQGSIGWWLNKILVPSLQYFLMKINNPLFIDPITPENENRMIETIETLCDWDIWSTKDDEARKAMRSNTIANVLEAFPKYTYDRLIKEVM